MPPISVVVCTRDRPADLATCLEALAGLDYPEYEVVVVDNASAGDDTRRIALAAGARCVREERPGLDWARNRGIRESRHDIVAFVDDDARADAGWLAAIARAFADPAAMAVTGLVLPAELETRAQRLYEHGYGTGMGRGVLPRRWRWDRMSVRQRIGVQALGVGANMAFRREAFALAGEFDTALDVGTPSGGAGDLDMLFRVLRAGGVVRYEPRAVVRHRHRPDLEGLGRQLGANGRSFGVYLIKRARESRDLRAAALAYAAGTWMPWLVARVARAALGLHVLPLALTWAELRGALGAPAAYRRTYARDRDLRGGPVAALVVAAIAVGLLAAAPLRAATPEDVGRWAAARDASALAGALADPRLDVRIAALEAVEPLHDPRATGAVAALARSEPYIPLRLRAWWVLAAQADPDAAPLLRAGLADADDRIREASAWGLANLALPDTAGELAKALRDPYARVREAAATAFQRLPPGPAAGDLEALLADPDASVRIAAIHALGSRAPPRPGTRDAVAGVLGAPSAAVRGAAAEALAAFGDPLGRRLVDALGGAPDARARLAALHDARAVPLLAGLLDAPDPATRAAAAGALAALEDPQARAALRAFGRRWNLVDRRIAAEALLGDTSRPMPARVAAVVRVSAAPSSAAYGGAIVAILGGTWLLVARRRRIASSWRWLRGRDRKERIHVARRL